MASEFTMNKKSNSRDRSYDSEFISIFESFRAAKKYPYKNYYSSIRYQQYKSPRFNSKSIRSNIFKNRISRF